MAIRPAALALGALAFLPSCKDETLTGYVQGANAFALEEVNGQPFPARATIDLSQEGRISGQAPCNSYFAAQTAPYPWFEVTAIGASKRACPDLAAEGAFFKALSSMTLSEISGPVLILTNEAGGKMVFRAP